MSMHRVGWRYMKLEFRLRRDLNVWTLLYCQRKVGSSLALQKYIGYNNI